MLIALSNVSNDFPVFVCPHCALNNIFVNSFFFYPLYFIFIISLLIDLNRIPFDLVLNQNWFQDLI